MKPNRIWQGVRLRHCQASADPDAPPRLVTLPAAWEDEAAEAIAGLVPGTGAVVLPVEAEAYVRRLTRDPALQTVLHGLLLQRRAVPGSSAWQGSETVRFTLNLAGFVNMETGFDLAGLREACGALRLVASAVGLTGLDDMLAALGLDYDGEVARGVGGSLAALIAGSLGSGVSIAASEVAEVIPGLAEALAEMRSSPRGLPGCPEVRLALLPAGPEDALLGVETVGIAPAFAATTTQGSLTRAARARLAARGLSVEAALAATLQGAAPLPLAGDAAARAMAEALSPWLEGSETALVHRSGSARREDLPARRRGFTQKAAVGGHRLYVTTGEYADGRLGEVSVSLSKESPAVRGLMDSLAAAVSVGLQHGVPLRAFVEAFAGTSFGPAGAVEGDPNVTAATSLPDYVVRTLAAAYLGEMLPEPRVEEPPVLPLPLRGGQGRRLRVVV